MHPADGSIFAGISNEHQLGKIVAFNFDQGINGEFRINDLYTEKEGLLIRSKVKISEAPDGKLWVASNAHDLGVYVLSDQKWSSFKISDQFGGVNSQNDILDLLRWFYLDRRSWQNLSPEEQETEPI